jgi:hypothetical protein
MRGRNGGSNRLIARHKNCRAEKGGSANFVGGRNSITICYKPRPIAAIPRGPNAELPQYCICTLRSLIGATESTLDLARVPD